MMLSALRKRYTYANITVTLALVFAISGGAYAASRYVITSTRQISPKVLKALQGKAGTAGTAGPAGTQGQQGPAGPAGPKGEAGAQGAKGEPGAPGAKGDPGTTGFTSMLPPGKTETGAWTFSTTTLYVSAAIPFPIPLAAALGSTSVHYVNAEGTEEVSYATNAHPAELVPTTSCPGTAEAPQAKPGNLCVYQTAVFGVQLVTNTNLAQGEAFPAGSQPKAFSGERGAGTSGAVLLLGREGGAGTETLGWGTWAVTAEE